MRIHADKKNKNLSIAFVFLNNHQALTFIAVTGGWVNMQVPWVNMARIYSLLNKNYERVRRTHVKR